MAASVPIRHNGAGCAALSGSDMVPPVGKGIQQSTGRVIALGRLMLDRFLQQAGELRRSRALIEELAGLKLAIAAHTERVTALCAASAARWSHL